MAHAYTPGLRISAGMTIRNERRLPLNGEILVETGEQIEGEKVIAKTELPGNVQILNVANLIGRMPSEILDYMKIGENSEIQKGDLLAETNGLFGFFKSSVRSPIDGTIEKISEVTGQVILREPPKPIELKGYIDGTIVEILPAEGAVVETYGTYIQGIFGLGGEMVGTIKMVANSPEEVLSTDRIDSSMENCVIVCGALLSNELMQKAIEMGVRGVIAGGMNDEDLRELLGYELGVAITGSEELGITIILTEGFGKIAMAQRTFELLKKNNGMKASISGATQIRAGVVRPEVLIAHPKEKSGIPTKSIVSSELTIGSVVRIIREPHFGMLGNVIELPIDPQQIETGAKVRVVELELSKNGDRVLMPRANVELIKLTGE